LARELENWRRSCFCWNIDELKKSNTLTANIYLVKKRLSIHTKKEQKIDGLRLKMLILIILKD